jgi:hypothetical protein
MAVRPPGKDELAAIARGYGMHLSDEDLGSFEPLVAGLLSSYDAVEDLYAQIAPEAPAGRTWKQPDPAENPLGAWYVRTRPLPLTRIRVAIRPRRSHSRLSHRHNGEDPGYGEDPGDYDAPDLPQSRFLPQ